MALLRLPWPTTWKYVSTNKIILVDKENNVIHLSNNIQVLYSMVMPSLDTRLDRCRSFQLACVKKAPLLVQCLSDKDFLEGAAPHTRRYV